MSSTISAVLFDLYKTLVDVTIDEDKPRFWEDISGILRTWNITFAPNDLRRRFESIRDDERKTHADGFVIESVFRRLLTTPLNIPTQDQIDQFARCFRRASIEQLAIREYTTPLLLSLRTAGYRIGLVSNTEALLTLYDLDHLKLPQYFDAVVLSSAIGYKKPDARIFECALNRLGVTASDAIFVGDNFHEDVEGAMAVGMRAIFVNNGLMPLRDRDSDQMIVAQPQLASLLSSLAAMGIACDTPGGTNGSLSG